MTSKSGRGTAMLAGLFAAGLAVTLFAYIDVGWTHWLILKDSPSRKGAKSASVDPQQLQKLRQSILIASNNAVLWEAPVAGFLHATNNLDTLGVDQPNTMCKFARK